jgi:VanZ family protein
LLQNVCRATAWIILAAIVLLTIVPPDLRPITSAPHDVEHAAVFLLDGLAFAFGYRGREWLLSIAALPLCAGLEIAQLFVPGRHARISDFAVDVIAALMGIAAGSVTAQNI